MLRSSSLNKTADWNPSCENEATITKTANLIIAMKFGKGTENIIHVPCGPDSGCSSNEEPESSCGCG